MRTRKITYWEWLTQIFWFVGWMLKAVARGHFSDAVETFFWLRLHCSHKCEVADEGEPLRGKDWWDWFGLCALGGAFIFLVVAGIFKLILYII